jgi:methionine biosynthesis protein MetW
MRDSALKRTLVDAYFSWREVQFALTGMVRKPVSAPPIDGYDEYWRHRAPGSLHPRFEIIASQIGAGHSVLDVGCGDGVMLEYLTLTKKVRAVGIDVSGEAVRRARERGVDARVESLADVRRAGASFDHVVMSEVVEHLADAERFVIDAWTLARKTLWLTFPNIAYFPHRLRLLSGKFPVQWVVFPGEHLRFWSVPDFATWLAGLSLPVSRQVASNGFTFARLHRAWPNLFGNQIVVRCDR